MLSNMQRAHQNFCTRAHVRSNGQLCLDFSIGNLGLEWLDASSVVDGVREATDAFIQNLE